MPGGAADIGNLSLCGLLGRLDLIEGYKQIRKPDDEQSAVLETEGATKKAIAEQLPARCAEGLTPHERDRARAFLEAQVKSVDRQVAGSEKRVARLKELLAGVAEAASVEEPAHVQRARAELKKADKEFVEVNKAYEKWDKGKQMLSIDEIKALKRRHEESQKRLEAAKGFVDEQLARKAEAAAERPKALEAKAPAPVPREFRPGPPKAKAVGPAVHVRPSGGAGAPGGALVGAGRGGGGYPAAAALRQGQVAAQVRAELAAEAVATAAEDAERPRPKPPPAVAQARPSRPAEEDSGPVLSYGCTCRAVAEYLGIGESDARNMAESSSDFRSKLDAAGWEWVQERSLAIEKADREVQREKEKKKAAAAVARNTGKMAGAPMTGVAPTQAAAAASSQAAAPKKPGTKAKAKPKPAAPKQGALAGLAGANRFGGLDDDSDDDGGGGGGWSTVRR